tara:strand:+ start:390 stop:638 length:249 start_codon:yes stop_codon:yes gene_type:complete
MSVIKFIDNTPLFTTLAEAKGWAKLNGLIGYHTHLIAPTAAKPLGQKGYMGGANHQQIASAKKKPIAPTSSNLGVSSGGGGY